MGHMEFMSRQFAEKNRSIKMNIKMRKWAASIMSIKVAEAVARSFVSFISVIECILLLH